MTEVVVVCRPAGATGFRLAGVPVREAETAEEAGAVLDALQADGRAGVVLVEDALHRDGGRPGLVVVPFPGPAWRATGPDERVVEILRRAIGYRVRL